MGDIRSRLASFSLSTSLLIVVGLVGGCGDNTPKQTGSAGNSGATGGTGGSAGDQGGSGGGAGVGGLAGADAGMAGQGGIAGLPDGGGGAAAIPCYDTSFSTPSANNANLTVSDDNNHNCGDGFQYTVSITSAAPDGTMVTLYDGNTVLRTVQVMNHAASFDVQLSTGSTAQALSVQYPDTTACSVVTHVTVMCDSTLPSCTISKPVISPTHPDLNGVASTAGGDRTSSAGSDYQATFTVSTNAENGQPVKLAVDNAANPTAVSNQSAIASNGTATFSVTLTPDGTYEAVATCTNKNGISGTSAKVTYVVDTTPPDLTVTKPSEGMFVVGGTVDVCGTTTQSDAAGLQSSLGPGQSNFCVTVGASATPTCVPMAAVNSPSCVSIPCPGSAPFNLKVQLSDAAGNPTVVTRTGITCASSHPTVQIVSPLSDAPLFQDASKHILAIGAPTGQKDQDSGMTGAQFDVVACTDVPGTAVLTAGHVGDTSLTQLGSTVTTAAAMPSDNCPTSLPNVARFAGVTLPESNENAAGSLAAATRLVVSVTSSANTANTGTSQPDDVWVDTTAPNVSLSAPPGLCGSFIQSSTTVTEDLSFNADYRYVVVDVTNGSSTTTYDTPAFMSGVATFPGVALAEGLNNLTVTASDPAGNATIMTPDPCAVTVGAAPVVTFTSPTNGAVLCPFNPPASDPNHNPYHALACVDDTDTATAGWQGTLTVSVSVGGSLLVNATDLVTFTLGSTVLGSANLDGTGHAHIDNVTIPEGVQTIVATTGTIANAGVGSGSVTVTADTLPPNAPTGLFVLEKDRRATSMQVTWTAPSDAGGGNVTSYQIRYARTFIDSSNFDNPPLPATQVTTAIPFGTTNAGSPGDSITVLADHLYIENCYYFAVEALDIAGNRSAPVSSPNDGVCTCNIHACSSHFIPTALASGAVGVTSEQFGVMLDGSGDVNNDGLSDLIVASSNGKHAYLYLGQKTTFSSSAASTIFTGDGTTPGFGRAVAAIGDIDGDKIEDLAVADTAGSPPRVFIYKGRSTWPATLGPSNADYVITGDASYVGAAFGNSLARLGDFNGDGKEDFAIGAYGYAGGVGRVVIILGKAGFGSIALPDTTNAITIDGDSSTVFPIFGRAIVGLGNVYSGSAGTSVAISAPGFAGYSSSAGLVYIFRGQPGTGGSISLASADNIILGPGPNADVGVGLANLGAIKTAVPSLGISNPSDSTTGNSGSVYVMSGDSSSGYFSTNTKLVRSSVSRQGQVVIGGSISGRNTIYSILGGPLPDLIVAPQTASSIQIIEGSRFSTLGSTLVDSSSLASAQIAQPSSWGATGTNEGTLIPDVNGDGYPDFAIANAVGAVAGSAIVYW
jgi:FG-GAP-like repeat/FG-GAP repeat